MTRVKNFVIDLARAGKNAKEIKTIVEAAYGVNAISRSQVFKILAIFREGKDTSDMRAQNPKKTRWTVEMIEAVRAMVDEDHRVTMLEIERELSLSHGTIFKILHDDLGLTKKAARWVPKLLSAEQKEERVKCAIEFRRAFFKDG